MGGTTLEGRVAIVTGAGRGIGRGIAIALAEAGADVVVNSWGEETTASTSEAVRETGRRALAVPGDSTKSACIHAVVDGAMETFGRIDVLVNNVGAGPKDGFGSAEDPLDQVAAVWDALYAQNLRPAVMASEAVLPHMRANGGGSIINLGSIAGHSPLPKPMLELLVHPAYGAMKAAVSHFTSTAAEMHGPDGVRVNAVAPGIVWTDAWKGNAEAMVARHPDFRGMDAHAWFDGIARGDYPAMFDRTPLRRAQTVEDIAAAVVFLASDAAASITGQVLMVDGGMVHPR